MRPKPRRSVAVADLLALTAMCLGCAALLWWGNSNAALSGRPNSAGGDSDQAGSLFELLEASAMAESPDGPGCAPAGAPFVVSGEGASAGVASDRPTLAPPEPMELAEGRQVIVVQVEADQAADGSDVRQR